MPENINHYFQEKTFPYIINLTKTKNSHLVNLSFRDVYVAPRREFHTKDKSFQEIQKALSDKQCHIDQNRMQMQVLYNSEQEVTRICNENGLLGFKTQEGYLIRYPSN